MTTPSKRKGDAAELEIAALLTGLLGFNVRRAIGAGRQDDTGDLVGIPDTTVEVKNYATVSDAINAGIPDLEREMQNSGHLFGAVLVRRRRARTHRWVVVMPVETWATYVRESSQVGAAI